MKDVYIILSILHYIIFISHILTLWIFITYSYFIIAYLCSVTYIVYLYKSNNWKIYGYNGNLCTHTLILL